MSNNQDSTHNPIQEVETTQAQDQEHDQQQEHTSQEENTNPAIAEAKKYRKRAQQAETELADTQQRYDVLLRSVIAQAAQKSGVSPKLIDAAGINPTDLLDEDGKVDSIRVDNAVRQAKNHFGLSTAENPFQGKGSNVSTRKQSWAEAFKNSAK